MGEKDISKEAFEMSKNPMSATLYECASEACKIKISLLYQLFSDGIIDKSVAEEYKCRFLKELKIEKGLANAIDKEE